MRFLRTTVTVTQATHTIVVLKVADRIAALAALVIGQAFNTGLLVNLAKWPSLAFCAIIIFKAFHNTLIITASWSWITALFTIDTRYT